MSVGSPDGELDGEAEGISDGKSEGSPLGAADGVDVGVAVGVLVGVPVGVPVGPAVGVAVGAGDTVGVPVGASVSYPINGNSSPHTPHVNGHCSCVTTSAHCVARTASSAWNDSQVWTPSQPTEYFTLSSHDRAVCAKLKRRKLIGKVNFILFSLRSVLLSRLS